MKIYSVDLYYFLRLNTIDTFSCIDICNRCYWDFINFLYTYNIFSIINTLPILFLNRLCDEFAGEWGADFDELMEFLDEMTLIKEEEMDTFYEMDKLIEMEDIYFFKLQNEFWFIISMADYFMEPDYEDTEIIFWFKKMQMIAIESPITYWGFKLFDFEFFNIHIMSVCTNTINLIITLYFLGVLYMLYVNLLKPKNNFYRYIDWSILFKQETTTTEEEVGAVEDIFIYYSLFIFIVAWFFFYDFIFFVTLTPSLLIFLWVLPALSCVLIYTPGNFIYNFGISFTSYLGGTISGIFFFGELINDIIICSAFFLRFFVQSIRFFLIIFMYTSLHDLFILNKWSNIYSHKYESFFDSIVSVNLSVVSMFFFFLKIIAWFLHFIFEIIHVFFILTAQSFAFVVMIFWLFFFYTLVLHQQILSHIKKYIDLKKLFICVKKLFFIISWKKVFSKWFLFWFFF